MLCRAVPAAIYRYNDFKKYADEDAAAEYMYGMECLFRFYSYGLENNFRVPLYKVSGQWFGVVEGSGTTQGAASCRAAETDRQTAVLGCRVSCRQPQTVTPWPAACAPDLAPVAFFSPFCPFLSCVLLLLQDFEQLVLKDYQVYNSLYGLEKFWAFHHYAGVPQDAVVSVCVCVCRGWVRLLELSTAAPHRCRRATASPAAGGVPACPCVGLPRWCACWDACIQATGVCCCWSWTDMRCV